MLESEGSGGGVAKDMCGGAADACERRLLWRSLPLSRMPGLAWLGLAFARTGLGERSTTAAAPSSATLRGAQAELGVWLLRRAFRRPAATTAETLPPPLPLLPTLPGVLARPGGGGGGGEARPPGLPAACSALASVKM